ncbi:MAG: hypothetical protein BWX50_00278 [Euryarchaeota archaeon ADurb.Bin009]|nr:MAG: hypothetical protein BWX50_00278 [Euryarchaeota archaeon ADurb.Bin009]
MSVKFPLCLLHLQGEKVVFSTHILITANGFFEEALRILKTPVNLLDILRGIPFLRVSCFDLLDRDPVAADIVPVVLNLLSVTDIISFVTLAVLHNPLDHLPGTSVLTPEAVDIRIRQGWNILACVRPVLGDLLLYFPEALLHLVVDLLQSLEFRVAPADRHLDLSLQRRSFFGVPVLLLQVAESLLPLLRDFDEIGEQNELLLKEANCLFLLCQIGPGAREGGAVLLKLVSQCCKPCRILVLPLQVLPEIGHPFRLKW